MDAVEEVKNRLNIEDVIGEYVELRRSGRNFKGLSPFGNERTPSFMVSPEKQIWHDFSSGKGGNMFSFIMEVEGLDFKGALELLARKAGIDLDQFRTGRPNGDGEYKKRLAQVLELATRFYQAQLNANRPALEYVRTQRGFSKETMLLWRLGYSPSGGRSLGDFLTKHGFTSDEMKRAGLVTQRSHGLGDMFRGRIMIPLCDQQGMVVGFTARLLENNPDAPKYINTPQTPLYDKSRQVFGLHLAKEQIRRQGFVVVAEGNLDVISSHQASVTNVVASAGTAMTEAHLKILHRFTGDVRLSFDSDQAGLTATERVIPLAQKVGVSLSIVGIEGGKDPDELIQKDPKLWEQAIASPTYAIDWLIERYAAILDLTSAQGKRAFTDNVLQTVRRLGDPVEQEHYVRKIAKLTDSSSEAMTAKLNQKPLNLRETRKKSVKSAPNQLDKTVIEYQRLQDHLLGMILMEPKLRSLLDDAKPAFFKEGDPRQLFNFLKTHPEFTGNALKEKELQSIADYVKIVSLQYEELYQGLGHEQLLIQATRLKARLIDSYVRTQKHRIANAMLVTTEESELAKMIQKVNALNDLIKHK